MKKLTLLTFAFVFISTMAFAQHDASVVQSGDDNSATVDQDGTLGSNNATIEQVDGGNMADVRQKGDSPGVSPYGSEAYTNNVLLDQSNGSEATINQTGRDYVALSQAGGSVAEINQDYGERHAVLGINGEKAIQTGGSELYVRQQGTLELGSTGVRRLGSELRISQYGSDKTDIKQRDGAYAQILQDAGSNYAFVRQDRDATIMLKQNGTSGSDANIDQTGDDNAVVGLSGLGSYALQAGSGGHTLDVDQFGGTGNMVKVSQLGMDNAATISQNGANNTATVSQN